MHALTKKIFLGGLFVLLLMVIGPIMHEYLLMHPYYAQFLSGEAKRQNLTILFLGVVCALFPVIALTKSKKISFWSFLIVLWLGLRIFATAYVGIKSNLFGGAWMKMLINSGFILGLGSLFFAQLLAFGKWINTTFLRLHLHTSIITFLFSLAIGLIGFLSIEYLLLLLNIAFPLVNRLVRGAGVYLVWKNADRLQEIRSGLMQDLFPRHENGILGHSLIYLIAGILIALFAGSLFYLGKGQVRARFMVVLAAGFVGRWIYSNPKLLQDGGGISRLFTLAGFADLAIIVLLILFVWYLYNGFVLAYIPYPTARDANHAYMFIPKMWALHSGYYRNEVAMRGFGGMWMPYITYWFSLFSFSGGFFGISADTIAIEMNFLSGIFVAIFGTGLVRVLLSVLRVLYKDTHTTNDLSHQLLVLLGSFLIFQWMSSGMGAFLVFIDNKTDMGVLTLIIVALLSGFLFFREHLLAGQQEEHESHQPKKRLILSGLFFAFAVLAKPTAMFDVLNFFLLLRGSWFGLLGVFGLPLLIMGGLTLMKMNGVDGYFSKMIGGVLAGIGGIGFGIDFLLQGYKKLMKYGKFLLLRCVTFLIIMVGVKLLYYIPDTVFYGNGDRGLKEWVKTMLLVNNTSLQQHQQTKLLVQNASLPPRAAACSLQSEGISDPKELYKDVKPIVGDAYSEDVGRYVGYGWKGNPSDQGRGVGPFADTRWINMMDVGCHPFSPFFLDSHDAVVLCESEEERKSFTLDRLTGVQNKLRPDGEAYGLIEQLKQGAGTAPLADLMSTYREKLLALEGIMQGESMKIAEKTIQDQQGVPFTYKEAYLPYKYLNFFNITFNWSLQNLSSYYTDIGIIWLLLIGFSVIGLLYGIIQRERFLITIHAVTIFGRLLWLVIGGGILWYGIGIVVRSILSFITFLYALSRRSDNVYDIVLVGLLVAAFLYAGLWQLGNNMVRISTQGGGGPFMRYKTNYGTVQRVLIGDQGQIIPSNVPTGKYTSNDVFSLQFPHYKKFLQLINDRSEGEGALIAGTYARYFITNQTKVISDQFLTDLWQRFSDNNVCRSYLRLQDKGLKYLVIDPNIGTVVQGEGNKGLFERFFARLSPSAGTIEQHGTMSMLAELAQNGYIRYVSSNNLGAKYALILPDSAFGGSTGDALTVTRAKMMVARFFQEQTLISSIIAFADQRVREGTFFEDLADVLGAQVSPALTQKIVQGTQLNPNELTEDEKKVLMQFFGLRQQLATNPTQYQQTLQNIVMQSLGAGNQVIVIEVVKS